MAVDEEGMASPEAVDTVVSTTFGFRLPFFGPFATTDMAGLDVYAKSFAVLEEGLGERFSPPAVLTELVDAGRHGTKAGSGFYELDPARRDELGPSSLRPGQRTGGARS